MSFPLQASGVLARTTATNTRGLSEFQWCWRTPWNSAARMITGTRKYDNIKPVLKGLHWLPMNERVQFKVLVLVFKALHGLAPSYIQELIKPYTPRRALRSTSSLTVDVPVTRTKTYGDRSFSKAGAELWNKLPEDLRSIDTLGNFKGKRKSFLFQRAYD